MTGEEIKKLRTSLKLTQEEFGLELGVSQRAVSSWESNTNDLPISIIHNIYIKWGVSPNNIILGSTNFNLLMDQLLKISEDKNIEKDLIKYIEKYILNHNSLQLNKLVCTVNANTFLEKLAEVWNNKNEKLFVILYCFIEYIQKQQLNIIDNNALIEIVDNFSIPKKIRLKHSLAINKKEKLNLKEWMKSTIDDIEANMLLRDLIKAKDFINTCCAYEF